MNKKDLIKNKKGVVLLLTMFILSGILIVTLGAADLVMTGIKMNRLTGYSTLAFFASEAGLERSLFMARESSYVYPGDNQPDIIACAANPGSCVLTNDSAYIVKYATSTPAAGYITFSSIGNYLGVKRSVQSSYQVGSGRSCTPSCLGKVCGEDDDCGGICTSCPSGESCVAGSCEATANEDWLSDPSCPGIDVYATDLFGTYQWETTGNTAIACVSPQCTTGLDSAYPSKNALVASNMVDFSLYPARNACKNIGGRLPTITELICVLTYSANYGNNFRSPYWSSIERDPANSYIVYLLGTPGNLYPSLGASANSNLIYARCVRGE